MTGIYCIENTVNGNKYIGQAADIRSRWNQHRHKLRSGKHYNTHLQRAWNVYGEESFTFYVIELCSLESLSQREQYYIQKFDTFEHGYNMTLGGEGTRGCLHTEEYKKLMSKRFSGRTYTEETLRKMSAAKKGKKPVETEARKAGRLITRQKLTGKKRTQEQCQNISNALKGNIPWNKGKKMPENYVHPRLGVHLTDETKAKISAAHKGMRMPESVRLTKIKHIKCVETGEVYESITEAAKAHGVTIGAVSRALRGKSKTCAGKTWAYIG